MPLNTSGRRGLATERSRDARTLAEATVVTLVHVLGDFESPMILDRFGDPSRDGAIAYARQAKLAHPDSDVAVLRQDAVAAVADFVEALNLGPLP